MEDRRIFERIPVKLPLKLIDLSSNQEIDALACDVSAKGLGILTRQPLKSGDALELWLEMPDKRTPFYTRGNVVWIKSQVCGEYEYRNGICLEKAELMGMSRIFKG